MRTMLALAGLAAAVAACGPAEAPAPVAPPVVTFIATDFAFTGPETVPAGHTTIRMETSAESTELHHVQLVKLEDGGTFEALIAAMANPGPLPAWASLRGGPNAPAPGGVSEAVVELSEGNWAAICVIPGPGGPHFAQGMVHSFQVTPNASPAPAPEAHIVATMTEYGYAFSSPLTAGTHVIRVDNAGQEPHEMILVRLDEGRSAQDVVSFIMAMEGHGEPMPPPGLPVGGTTNFGPGGSNWITVTLEPGTYAVVCVFPDDDDGRPHMLHGMAQQFTVE